jgi:hypothetical protein
MPPRTVRDALIELEALRRSMGLVLRAKDVVEASKDPRSPLHSYFLWGDDRTAAHLHRLEVADLLIRRVKVTFERRTEEGRVLPVTVRQFSYSERDRGYMDTRAMMADPGLRDMVLRRAMSELRAFRTKYQSLEELAGVLEAIEGLFEPVAPG